MKEPYGEGVANHSGPQPCAGCREAAGEALAWVHVGQVLSSESKVNRRADRMCQREGHTADRVIASGPSASRSLRP